MAWFEAHILSILVFAPLGTAIACSLSRSWARYIAMLGAIFTFLCSCHLWFYFDSSSHHLQFSENYSWIKPLGIRYILGLDGINLLLVMLTTFLTPLILLSMWHVKEERQRTFLSLFMLLECGMLGALLAFDLFFFYVFWELMLIPMYFIIGVWGGTNRIYATTKFVLYTVLGSLLMLLASIYLYIAHGNEFGYYSSNLLDLYQLTSLSLTAKHWLFAAFALAFAVKIPMWPFHTWLPHAHTQAPTAGSVVLAGVLLKMGSYGLLRFAIPLFPEAAIAWAPALCALGVIGIVYGALTAWVQEDAKQMVAYSSVSHLGFVVIGSLAYIGSDLSVEALTGAIYQMINHGISTGALFFLVGIIYERRHTRMLSDYGGLAKQMPVFAVMLMIATLGSVGLPGTGGFIGEFLILLGAFQSHPALGIFAATGVLLGAIYMLKLCLDLMFGPIQEKNANLTDLNWQERGYMLPLAALILFMGIYPGFFLDKVKSSAMHLAKHKQGYSLQLVQK